MDLSTRTVYLVAYDVSDPRRLNRCRQVLLGFGDRVQLSVFRCELTARQMVDLRRKLVDAINALEDQVLVADLGPAEGRGAEALSTMGRACAPPSRGATVV